VQQNATHDTNIKIIATSITVDSLTTSVMEGAAFEVVDPIDIVVDTVVDVDMVVL